MTLVNVISISVIMFAPYSFTNNTDVKLDYVLKQVPTLIAVVHLTIKIFAPNYQLYLLFSLQRYPLTFHPLFTNN